MSFERKYENKSENKDAPPAKKNKIDYFSKIAEIANFISNIKPDNELCILAVNYGVLMLGAITEEAYRIIGKSNIKDKADALNIKELDRAFEKTLPQIRNCLADHFHRFTEKNQTELLNTLSDLAILKQLSSEAAFEKKRACFKFEAFSFQVDSIGKQPVSWINRLAFIIYYLEKAENYLTYDSSLTYRETFYAVSMLLVAAGTCARELQDNLEQKRKFNNSRDILNVLGILKFIRNDLVHDYITNMTTDPHVKTILSMPKALKGILDDLNKFSLNIAQILNQNYKPKDFNSSNITSKLLLPSSLLGLTARVSPTISAPFAGTTGALLQTLAPSKSDNNNDASLAEAEKGFYAALASPTINQKNQPQAKPSPNSSLTVALPSSLKEEQEDEKKEKEEDENPAKEGYDTMTKR